jgi:hypothetical protein
MPEHLRMSVYDVGLFALFRHAPPGHEDALPPPTIAARDEAES